MKTYGGAEVQLHSFSNSTVDGGEWELPSRPLQHPGKNPLPTEKEAVWVAQRVWRFSGRRENHLLLKGFEPRTVQPVA